MKFCSFIFLLFISHEIFADTFTSYSFKGFPQTYEVFADGVKCSQKQSSPKEYMKIMIPSKINSVIIKAEGFLDLNLEFDNRKSKTYEFKLEKDLEHSFLTKISELDTGNQPKSVSFSPDGKLIFVALLLGPGVDVFEVETLKFKKRILFPEKYAKQMGFVETCVLPWQNELWVSQMTTNSVHIIDLQTLEYKMTMDTGGDWPKVIAAHPSKNLVYVSNWVGESVAVFDSLSKKRIALYKTTGTPRGLAFSPDGIFLYVASFGTGALDKFRVSTGKKEKTINMGPGAKRHLIASKTNTYLFATDMERGEVWVFDMVGDKFVKKIPIGPKLNTCDLSPDGRFLFISSRGTNGPRDYLYPGPDFGTMSVLDTQSLTKIDWVWGRNQPTGLAVSPTDKIVVFSDFLDHNIEIYNFEKLYK